jgi:hypothetical protein
VKLLEHFSPFIVLHLYREIGRRVKHHQHFFNERANKGNEYIWFFHIHVLLHMYAIPLEIWYKHTFQQICYLTLVILLCACCNSAPGQQLGLYDVRLRRTEIHSFGWKQETSDSQSALINQSWSPDGWYVSSGTADPKIHIFDIRYTISNAFISVIINGSRIQNLSDMILGLQLE